MDLYWFAFCPVFISRLRFFCLFYRWELFPSVKLSQIKGYEADLCKCYRPHHHLILCGQAVLPTMSHYRFLFFLQLKMHSFHPLFLSTGQLQSKELSHFLFLDALLLWSVYLWGCLCVIALCSYVTVTCRSHRRQAGRHGGRCIQLE